MLVVLVTGMVLTGCSVDWKLNGTWEGPLWEKGNEIPNSTIKLEFSFPNKVKLYEGNDVKQMKYFAESITGVIDFVIENNKFEVLYSGIYKIDGEILYISLVKKEGEQTPKYPPEENLDPKVGPVYVLRKK